MKYETVAWRDGRVVMLDQRRLPTEEAYVECDRPEEVAEAIRNMTIRGAPAIGVAAAMGIALGVMKLQVRGTRWTRLLDGRSRELPAPGARGCWDE